MGDPKRHGGAGWELFIENSAVLTVNFVPATDDPKEAAVRPEPSVMTDRRSGFIRRGIIVSPREPLPRDEWVHVFFTFTGNRSSTGFKLYVNGKLADSEVRLN